MFWKCTPVCLYYSNSHLIVAEFCSDINRVFMSMLQKSKKDKLSFTAFLEVAKEFKLFEQEFGRSSPNTYEYLLTNEQRKMMIKTFKLTWTKLKLDLSRMQQLLTVDGQELNSPLHSIRKTVFRRLHTKMSALDFEFEKDPVQLPLRYVITLFRSVVFEVSWKVHFSECDRISLMVF